jgi:hypothetical protein
LALALDGSATSNTTTVVLTTALAGVICVVATINDASIVSIADDAGNVYQSRANVPVQAAPTQRIEFWYAVSDEGVANNDIVLTLSAAPNFLRVSAFGVSGADLDDPFDTHASLPDTSGALPADPRTVSTEAAEAFVIGAFRMSAEGAPTAGDGFTGILSGQANTFTLTEYQVVHGPQTNLSVIVGTGVGGSNGGIADAIKAVPVVPPEFIGNVADGGSSPQGRGQRLARPYWWHSYFAQWLDELEEEERRLREKREKARAAEAEKREAEALIRVGRQRELMRLQAEYERLQRQANAVDISKAVRSVRDSSEAERAALQERAEAALQRVEARKQLAQAELEAEELRKLRQIARSPHRRFEQRFEAALTAARRQGWRAKLN